VEKVQERMIWTMIGRKRKKERISRFLVNFSLIFQGLCSLFSEVDSFEFNTNIR
jgi:hypothetical protein